jgi:glycosyltransferase involved in cell wall biosynthesis
VAVRYRQAPVVATAHYPEANDPAWLRWLVRRLHQQTARWIVPCPSLAEFWHDRGVSKGRIEAIAPAAECAGSKADAAVLRRQAGIPAGDPIILTAGRLLGRKGFKHAIWTLDILKFIFPDLYLVIAGDGPDRPRLEQFAADLQVTDRVRFLGWRDDLADWLHLADIVWAPSYRDDLPDIVLEALAAGKPIVASHLPALADVIQDGQTGFLVPPGDKPALAKQTRHLLEQPELRQRIGEAAREAAQRRFHVDAMIDRHLELYQQVVRARTDTRIPASGVA